MRTAVALALFLLAIGCQTATSVVRGLVPRWGERAGPSLADSSTSPLTTIVSTPVILALSLLAIACQTVVVDKSFQRIQSANELVVGIDPSYPPFENVNASGELAGYDVDLATELARRLGLRARFISLDIGSIHDGLIAKKFDVIVSSLPPLPEYAKRVAYSRPYFNAGQVLVLGPHADTFNSVDDLSGQRVGFESGSSAEVETRKLAARFPNLAFVSFTTVEAAQNSLRAGNLDVVVVDGVTALEWRAGWNELRVISEPLTVEPYVVAVRRVDGLLLKEIDRALVGMEQDGTLMVLRGKWLEMDSG